VNGILEIEREKCSGCGKCTEICLNDANEIVGKEMTASEVMTEVLKDKMFYDTSGGGLTVTGGEPSYQPEFTMELLRLAKDAEISLAIETCGIGSREFYEKAADLGTTFLYDIKCIDTERHRKLTGSDNGHIMSNLAYLMDTGADVIIRMPLVPGCNDSDEDIALLSAFLGENEGRYRYAEIMPYHALGTGKAEKIGLSAAYVRENAGEREISRWCSLFSSHGTDVRVSK
jgi:pyruvate formate lyase activating enzyme